MLLGAGMAAPVQGQSYTELFDDIAALPTSGWTSQNASSPLPTSGGNWYQGVPVSAQGPFDALDGAPNAYIGVDFGSTSGSGTISNWLLTPNRVLRNGDVFQFYTRKRAVPIGQSDYPDRLEVRMSRNGASTNVGTSAMGVGDFSDLLLSINPALAPNVYPQAWTQFTITVAGLPAPTSGRIAFRYYVTNGGPSGVNADYIGIDHVAYTSYICPGITLSGAVTTGTWGLPYSSQLSQTGALGAPSYYISAGAPPPGISMSQSGLIAGTPTQVGSFNFTVGVSDASGCSGSMVASITIAPGLPSPPQNVSATAGNGQVQVSWNPPESDGGDNNLSYHVRCVGATIADATGPSPQVVGGLVNGTPYVCQVSAINGAGEGPAQAANAVTPYGVAALQLSLDDAQQFVRGGQTRNYVLQVSNGGPDIASDVAVSQTLSTAFLAGATQWTVWGGNSGTDLIASGSGPLNGSGFAIAAAHALTWVISTPVAVSASGATADTSVSVGSVADTASPHLAADSDTLVVFRDSFDLAYGDGSGGAFATTPLQAVGALAAGHQLVVPLPAQPGVAMVETLARGQAGDGTGLRLERLNLGAVTAVRLVSVEAQGLENTTHWLTAVNGTTVSISLAGDAGGLMATLVGSSASATIAVSPDAQAAYQTEGIAGTTVQ